MSKISNIVNGWSNYAFKNKAAEDMAKKELIFVMIVITQVIKKTLILKTG